MRSLILLSIGFAELSYGMVQKWDHLALPTSTAAIMDNAGGGETQYLIVSNIQHQEHERESYNCRDHCRHCCDKHGAKIGACCCCVLCAVGVGVGLGYLPSYESLETGFDTIREFLEWIRGM